MKQSFFTNIGYAAAVSILLSACQKSIIKPINDNGTVLNLISAVENSSSKVALPLKGEFATVSHSISPPPLLQVQVTGTGKVSHLGASTLSLVAHVNLRVPPPNPVTGTQVITAANGDQLFSTFTGISRPPDANGNITGSVTHTITGGTGRFLNATGSFESLSSRNVKGETGTISINGTISY